MPCLNSHLRQLKNYIFYIRNKHQLQLKHILFIYIYVLKTTTIIFSTLTAILDAILYQGSLMNYSQITRSHFEPFFVWNNLNLMQESELSSSYDVFIKQA